MEIGNSRQTVFGTSISRDVKVRQMVIDVIFEVPLTHRHLFSFSPMMIPEPWGKGM